LNFTFIEYGGSNLVHYLFEDNTDPVALNDGIKAYFVNTKIFLIADSDFNKNKKHQFYKKLEHKRFQYIETEYPEIENLIPPKVLNGFLQERLNIPATIADQITSYSYKTTKLGKFLSEHFVKHQITRKVKAKTGGTLKSDYKAMLAEYVVNEVQNNRISWDDLKSNDVIADLIPKLYNFIETHNK
jgi:hypothetical protein